MKTSFVSRVVCGLSVLFVAAQSSEGQIRWRGETQELQRKAPAQIKSEIVGLSKTQNSHFILQLEQPLTEQTRAQIEAGGVRLQNYLGNNAFFATMDKTALDAQKISAVPGLTRVSAIPTERKLHEDLNEGIIRDWTVIPQELARERAAADGKAFDHDDEGGRNPIVAVYAKFHRDIRLEPEGTQIAQKHGAFIVSQLYVINGLVIELPFNSVKTLAAEDAIEWIEPALPHFSECNSESRVRTGADIVQGAPYNLTGAGVSALVYDGGKVRTTHLDFQGRAIVGNGELACETVSDHATHVAGTVGGAGIANPTHKGMAPGVDIVSYAFNTGGGCTLSQGFLYTDPGDLQSDYNTAINVHGADIANNSIGTNTAPNNFPCSWEGDYGVTDTVIDSIVRGSLGAPFRVVWANGNERQTSRCNDTTPGVPAGYHKTAPPACAKNHITVGALNSNDDSMTTFSSWGPADDDRMKPDVSGPGCQVGGDAGTTSCGSASDTAYSSKCGTSMASPATCGISCLLLQDYRVQFPGNPDFRNSTLKILLAHTAVDLGNIGPDYQFGYGSVRIQPAIDFMRTGNFLENSVASTGSTFQAVIVVGPSDTQLKVTLAWDDPPGTPNVSPALVNDLDLRVFDSSNNQYFPWTLGGLANVTMPAVRTQKNALDNIEQVLINNPTPGAYRVEVHGFNVPDGPQPFSLCGSPLLVNCSSQGIIALDRNKYQCSSTATIRVVDCDLNTDDGLIETVQVTINSNTEPGGETVTLTETAAETATFLGTISLNTTNAPGVLHVTAGDTVTATYIDADDGGGGMNVVVTDDALVDCTGPAISSVQVSNILPRSATVTLTTNEIANSRIEYGTSCGSLTLTATESGYHTSHTFNLQNLSINTPYFFRVVAEDEAGNSTTDNNSGVCYTFATPDLPELYTEHFSASDNDLDNRFVLFTPNASIDFYSACGGQTFTLPTDPTGGTNVTLGDNASTPIALGGNNVTLYGVSYNTVHLGSNGFLTFTAADTDSTETLADHFDTPRVSGLFDDIDPNLGGTVSYKILGDRLAVTWLNVPDNGNAATANTFQIEMYYDGRIRITWLALNASGGISGLSGSTSLSPDFFESDFSAFDSCGPQPPSAASSSVDVAFETPQSISLIAGDDGQPGPLSYIVMSLPAHPIRDPGDNQIISVVPHTLLNNGNQVMYEPGTGFFGNDSFTFKANDGGTFPTGGDSNTATVAIRVVPVLGLPFNEEFPTTTFDTNKWFTVSNATIDTLGLSPPSAPNSARFNGDPSGGDEIQTHLFNLSGAGQVRLTYSWQVRGGGESPDANDDLFIEYRDGNGAWQILQQHLGTLPDATTFTTTTMLLPPAALHSAFRLRIRNTATVGAFDDWFVDNISLISENDPIAANSAESTGLNTSKMVTLQANDPNMDPLTYHITSLPSVGTLRDPSAGTITSVPYQLPGNQVKYVTGPGGLSTNTSFQFKVNDGQTDSNIATVSMAISELPLTLASFPLDTNPGWSTMGQWAHGQPTGQGQFSQDPTGGYTGPNVYGYNLNGDYPGNLNPVQYLTTSAINCSAGTNIQLRFRRWLCVESSSFDHANIQVSNDNQDWVDVWNHSGPTLVESTWSLQTYSLGPVADNQSTVYIRWGMGTTDINLNFCGWNIDDIEILGVVPNQCSMVLRGDVDNDGDRDGDDIVLFVQTLINPGGATAHQLCASDLQVDAVINDVDAAELVNVLLYP